MQCNRYGWQEWILTNPHIRLYYGMRIGKDWCMMQACPHLQKVFPKLSPILGAKICRRNV